jgi:hypothetical protein
MSPFTSEYDVGPFITMQSEFFFLALLPPIMFEAGFSLQVKP